jgi:hypothetical protein
VTLNFDCPVAWCSGYRPEHGDEGDGPQKWLHTSEHEDIAELAIGVFFREGIGPTTFAVSITTTELGGSAEQLRADAKRLRTLAAVMEARAGSVEQ